MQIIEEYEEKRTDIEPAKNVRVRSLRVCAVCKHWRNYGGAGYCIRRGGFSCDMGDMTQYFATCDRWAADE
jgi:hypothetical protein